MNKPKLLLQACCGPCAIAAFDAFCGRYDVTVYFWGNNFDSKEEFQRRLTALEIVNKELNEGKPIIIVPYDEFTWDSGVEEESYEAEGGERCRACYEIRLRAGAQYAKDHGFDTYSTSLTVSPHKSSSTINLIGRKIGEEVGINFIEIDLAKNDGFRKSVEISKRLGIYRQKYCGCKYSLAKRRQSR